MRKPDFYLPIFTLHRIERLRWTAEAADSYLGDCSFGDLRRFPIDEEVAFVTGCVESMARTAGLRWWQCQLERLALDGNRL